MGGGPIPTPNPQTTASKEASSQRFLIYLFFITFIIMLAISNRGQLPFEKDAKFEIHPFEKDVKFEIHSISVLEPFEPGDWATTYLGISLTSINHDKYRDIIYDTIVVSVFHEKEILFVGILRPFHHQAGETKRVEETLVASIGYVEKSAVVGGGNFSVKIDARMKYAPGTYWERIVPVTARCESVSVEFPPPPSDPEVVTTVTEKLSDDHEFEDVLADVLVHLVEFEDVLVYVLTVLVCCCLCVLGFFYLCFWFITRLVCPSIFAMGRALF